MSAVRGTNFLSRCFEYISSDLSFQFFQATALWNMSKESVGNKCVRCFSKTWASRVLCFLGKLKSTRISRIQRICRKTSGFCGAVF